jgi:hypothetical protein
MAFDSHSEGIRHLMIDQRGHQPVGVHCQIFGRIAKLAPDIMAHPFNAGFDRRPDDLFDIMRIEPTPDGEHGPQLR